MKKNSILIFFIFFPFFLFSQGVITTKWYHDVLDTFKVAKKNWRSCIPYEIIEIDKNDLILGSYDFNAWSVRRIEKATGKIKWLNAKTPDYPDNSQRKFYIDNMFINKEENLDVYGIKSLSDNTITFGAGNPIRVTYDMNTGKEIATHFPEQPNKRLNNILKPGALSSYFLKEDGSGFYARIWQDNPAAYLIIGLDSNLVIKDTISTLYYTEDIDKEKAVSHGTVRPLKIRNHFYSMEMVWKNVFDSSSLQIMFYKIDTKGNIKIRKKIGTPLYNVLYYGEIKPISDGFLAFGLVDTTYRFFRDPPKASNTSMVAKIDTNGTIVWKTFLIRPEAGYMEGIHAIDDPKRGGSWALAGSLQGGRPNLYFIDKKGRAKFLAKINFPNNKEDIVPVSAGWMLKDGSLLMGYQYSKSVNDYSYPIARGVSLIAASDLDKYLADAQPVILPSFLVNVYPNPTQDILNIKVAESEEPLQVAFFDLQGKSIYQCDFQQFTTIETSNWHRGLYAYLIRDTLGRVVKSGKVAVE
jgi:hypothetical protein